MAVPALRVVDRNDPAWEGVIHLDRSSAEAHVETIRQFLHPSMMAPAIEAAEVDFVIDQRITIHGWHVGVQFNRRSMGRRTIKAGPVRELRQLAGRIVGVAYYDGVPPLDRVPVVYLGGGAWSSYSLGEAGEIITTEG